MRSITHSSLNKIDPSLQKDPCSRNQKGSQREPAFTGGRGGIWTLVTSIRGKTVFETAAFSRSATLPSSAYRNQMRRGVCQKKTLSRALLVKTSVLDFGRAHSSYRVLATHQTMWNSLAERWGFEPQIRFWRIHDFQSCSLSQTRTSLQLLCAKQVLHVRW